MANQIAQQITVNHVSWPFLVDIKISSNSEEYYKEFNEQPMFRP